MPTWPFSDFQHGLAKRHFGRHSAAPRPDPHHKPRRSGAGAIGGRIIHGAGTGQDAPAGPASVAAGRRLLQCLGGTSVHRRPCGSSVTQEARPHSRPQLGSCPVPLEQDDDSCPLRILEKRTMRRADRPRRPRRTQDCQCQEALRRDAAPGRFAPIYGVRMGQWARDRPASAMANARADHLARCLT